VVVCFFVGRAVEEVRPIKKRHAPRTETKDVAVAATTLVWPLRPEKWDAWGK
jgi:hypothetical protein